MQQDEQTTEQEPAEVPSETQPSIPQPNGKKGGKPPGEKPAQAPGSDQIAALKTQVAQAHTKLDALKKQVEQLGTALIGTERALEKPVLQTADDQKALRKAFLGFVEQCAKEQKDRSEADARMLDAVNKMAAFTVKACEAAVAGVELQTGLRPADARFVRQFVTALQAAKDGKGPTTAPTPPSPASRSAFWTGGRAAIACGAMVLVALCCAYFL